MLDLLGGQPGFNEAAADTAENVNKNTDEARAIRASMRPRPIPRKTAGEPGQQPVKGGLLQ